MVSKEYLSFSKRERTGIIILVILIIIMAVLPKFFCNTKPVTEKLPDKQLQQLAARKSNDYHGKKYRERDTIYVRKYVPSTFKNKNYHKPTNEEGYPKRKGMPASRLPWNGGTGNEETRRRDYTARPAWVRPKLAPIDINTADTSAFIALPGIGSKLANRIISFRRKLGGFHSVEQIREVYGLRDSVFQIIQPFLICQLSP